MTKTRSLLHLPLIFALALGVGACSTLADLDPTGLLSDSAPPATSQFPDAAAPQASDTAVGTTPDLASLPARPATTSPAQQQQQAQALAADGAQVQYSADALRGGTEAAAPVPGAPPPPSALALAAPPPPSAAPAAENDAPPTAEAAPPPAALPPPVPSPVPSAAPSVAPPAAAVAAVPPSAAAPAAAAPSPVAASLPPGAEPAVPANTPVRGTALASRNPSDAELGFRPSQAPPLDPSISQWVPAPIVARYRQTASNAGISTSGSAVAAVPRGQGAAAPGEVVANLGAVPTGPAAIAALNGGVTPTKVIYFPGDSTTLSAAARAEIRGAVQAFKAAGGAGTVRVVGHASSRTADMPVEKHLETIFDKSQARATAVAQELIHQGVPADKVLVEAVGDSQPIYYESMPKGEDGNRRAEIFVQG